MLVLFPRENEDVGILHTKLFKSLALKTGACVECSVWQLLCFITLTYGIYNFGSHSLHGLLLLLTNWYLGPSRLFGTGKTKQNDEGQTSHLQSQLIHISNEHLRLIWKQKLCLDRMDTKAESNEDECSPLVTLQRPGQEDREFEVSLAK